MPFRVSKHDKNLERAVFSSGGVDMWGFYIAGIRVVCGSYFFMIYVRDNSFLDVIKQILILFFYLSDSIAWQFRTSDTCLFEMHNNKEQFERLKERWLDTLTCLCLDALLCSG